MQQSGQGLAIHRFPGQLRRQQAKIILRPFQANAFHKGGRDTLIPGGMMSFIRSFSVQQADLLSIQQNRFYRKTGSE